MTQSQQHRSPSPSRSNTAQPTSPNLPRTPFSKRHASFNSPREVPLSSPSVVNSESVFPFFSASSSKPFDLDSYSSPTVSPQHTPLPSHFYAQDAPPPYQFPRQQMNMKLTQEDSLIASRRQKRNHTRQPSLGPPSAIASQLDHTVPSSTSAAAESTTIFPARPSSLAETYSVSYSSTLQNSVLAMPDRYSSSSLPIPSQIPFNTLPKAKIPPTHTPSSIQHPASELSQPSPVQMHSGLSIPVPSNRPGLRCPINSESTSSSSSSSSSSYRSEASVATSNSSLLSTSPTEKSSLSQRHAADESQPQPNNAPVTQPESQPAPRPISPFRAPRPPPPQPRAPALEGTAMRRYMTPSQLQSALPPSGTALSSPSQASVAAFSSASAMALLASDQYPPPEPPTILPFDPSHEVTEESQVHSHAPYMPFLSQLLPPPDSWIQVETMHSEYRLLVRLPGFSREGITLASKRRRILHIVADSWENGGGHFERRISFGYDADLAQVRAEFDGVMLRIAIPRRVSPISWNANTSPRMGRA